jgi:IS4 transposase
MSAIDIFDIYRTRFQIKFLFRDAKQNTGLTNCQYRKKEKLDFSFNASLSSINLSKALVTPVGGEALCRFNENAPT